MKLLLHTLISVHYNDAIIGVIASQITSLKIVYSIVYSDADQRKHQSSASLAFVRGIHRGPVNSPHKWPATRKMFPFDDVIMLGWVSEGNHILQQPLDVTPHWKSFIFWLTVDLFAIKIQFSIFNIFIVNVWWGILCIKTWMQFWCIGYTVRIAGPSCEESWQVTEGFPSQRTSNAEILWFVFVSLYEPFKHLSAYVTSPQIGSVLVRKNLLWCW